ncbi:MAG: hypothetical protein OIN86_02105 [Candidatus Methanoperedens sp.]|nr:hypothetical protein [Candidatus Methanoperedens sp.]
MIILKDKPQMNADERRFVKLLVGLPDHMVSPYALCAACPHVLRMGGEGGGGMSESESF